MKLCDGLDGLLGVVTDRLAVQERALARRRTDATRIDRLAAFFTAIYTNQPATLQTVAALAEELLGEARQAQPIRFVSLIGRFRVRARRNPRSRCRLAVRRLRTRSTSLR